MPDSVRQGEVFDGIAAAYDARRSGYPREIVAAAVELASLHRGSRVVEVGSGTGKLTEELIGWGLRIDAVEPGRNMIELARRRVKESDLVRYHVGRFEEVELPAERFDAVFAAAAFHWIDPSVGWARAAALLRPGGTIALLHPLSVREEPGGGALPELAAAFARLAPEIAADPTPARDEVTIRAGARERSENVSEVWAWLVHRDLAVPEAGTLFGPALFACVARKTEQTADELWAIFETTSRYHRLASTVRVRLQAECDRIVNRHGGILRSTQLVVLVTAQRR